MELGHLETIRKEANDVKDCFTRYAFQAFAFESAILGLILKYQLDDPFVTFAVLVGIALMIVVSRIGTHKYATANRNFGFELFVTQAKQLDYELEIGWEEALRAWRVVQATLFAEIFQTDGRQKDRPRENYQVYFDNPRLSETSERAWFVTSTLLPKGARFHPGAYLRTMLRLQRRLARWSNILFLFPAVHLVIQQSQLAPNGAASDVTPTASLALCVVFAITALVSLAFVNIEYRRRFARLRLLEDGFLSIHSCSKMWHAIVVCHNVAEQRCRDNPSTDYISELGRLAINLKQRILQIDEWILEQSNVLPRRQGRCKKQRRRRSFAPVYYSRTRRTNPLP